MKFSLLENGIDSLRQARINVDKNYLSSEYESFQLKDGLFNFIHGFEILSKYIISNKNEEGIIEKNSRERYRNAKKKINDEVKNVFDVDPQIKTISPIKALGRLKADFNLKDEKLYKEIKELIYLRNKLMHYTINMDNIEKRNFSNTLSSCIDETINYFTNQIPNFKVVYQKLERNYPYTEYDRWVDGQIAAAEVNYEESYIEHLIETQVERS